MLNVKTKFPKQQKSSPQQRWQENLLRCFIEMVKAPNGDFPALNKLSIAARDKTSFQLMVKHLSSTPEAQSAFSKFLSLDGIDLDQLSKMPSDTLGFLFAEHMRQNNFTLMKPKQIPDTYHFVLSHIYETHDIWHVITDSDTSVYGEAKIDAFSAAQFNMSRFFHSLVAKNIIKAATYDVTMATPYMDAITHGCNY